MFQMIVFFIVLYNMLVRIYKYSVLIRLKTVFVLDRTKQYDRNVKLFLLNVSMLKKLQHGKITFSF